VFRALTGCTDLVVAIGPKARGTERSNEATLPLTAAMAAKMKTQERRDAYRRRKWLAEPPNGWIKNVLGFRQFSMRGLHRVQAEWKTRLLGVESAADGRRCRRLEGLHGTWKNFAAFAIPPSRPLTAPNVTVDANCVSPTASPSSIRLQSVCRPDS